MITVTLHGAEFFARHGFYPEEQMLGCRFSVDMAVGFIPTGDLYRDNLSNTVNYERLYDMVTEQMKHPRKLIETLAQAIIDEIKMEYPDIETAVVTIKKINPPMRDKVAYSGVTISYAKASNAVQ
jgi:dihydroneopterin aldolase